MRNHPADFKDRIAKIFESEQTISMDVPFLTRMLEIAREDIKSDDELHRLVTMITDAAGSKPLSFSNENDAQLLKPFEKKRMDEFDEDDL